MPPASVAVTVDVPAKGEFIFTVASPLASVFTNDSLRMPMVAAKLSSLSDWAAPFLRYRRDSCWSLPTSTVEPLFGKTKLRFSSVPLTVINADAVAPAPLTLIVSAPALMAV